MFFRRSIIENLENWKVSNPRKPLILAGTRQIGKTKALHHFGQNYFKRYHYFNFEENSALQQLFDKDLDVKRIMRELALFYKTEINQHEDLIIFDEIQVCPKAISSLKYFAESMPELAICAAGSLLGLELSSFSFPVGKVTFQNMYPMSFKEFLEATDNIQLLKFLNTADIHNDLSQPIHQSLWDIFKAYLITGGMPEVISTYVTYKDNPTVAFKQVRSVQRDLYKTYLADIAKHAGKVNSMHISRVLQSAALQLSNTFDGESDKFKFKDVIQGKKSYRDLGSAIDWLLKAKLLLKVNIVSKAMLPLAAYAKENVFKLMLFDVGMLGCMTDLAPETIWNYDFGTYKGFLVENFVVQEILCNFDVEQLFSWSEGKAEIEFLLPSLIADQIIPLEVKSGSHHKSKSLASYIQRYNPNLAIMLSSRLKQSSSNVIKHYPLYYIGFLNDQGNLVKGVK